MPLDETNETHGPVAIEVREDTTTSAGGDSLSPGARRGNYSADIAKRLTGGGSGKLGDLSILQRAGKEIVRRNRQVQKHAVSRSDFTPSADRSMFARE